MDTNELISKLNSRFPDVILEKRRFGRSEELSVWIETKDIQKVAEFLKEEPHFRLNWLENLSVMQMDDALVLSYFLASTYSPFTFILRGSVVPSSPEDWVELPSVASLWPMAEAMENEAAELFGIRFRTSETSYRPNWEAGFGRLPKDVQGFPLRKSFAFPKTVSGIAHRPKAIQARPRGMS